MDNIDLRILECLGKNARMNSSEIAEKVPLSTSAVIERIKKLEASRTILGYTVVCDPAALGKDITALISVGIESPNIMRCLKECQGEREYSRMLLYSRQF